MRLLYMIILPTVFIMPACLPADEIARNINFTVCAPSEHVAAEIATKASELRRDLSRAWLGEEIPSGIGRAIIHVDLRDDIDEGTAWVNDRRDRAAHIVWLSTSNERASGSTLAHEITHVVLATRYPAKIPSWAHEGAASLADDENRARIRQQILDGFVRSGKWPQLDRALHRRSISPQDQVGYAIAASLTEYLVSLRDRPTFVRFASDAIQQGYARALQRHYGIRDVEQLQKDWRLWVSNSTL